MEDTFNRDYAVTFIDHRCWECGTFWAIEKWKDVSQCPRCAEQKNSNLHKIIANLEKTTAGLKGQITKLKGRK